MTRKQAGFALEFIYTAHPVPHEVAWYKWEFLRRNPEYRSDYEKFIQRFGSWFKVRGYWFDYDRRLAQWTKADEEYFYENIAPVIRRICQKWQIGNLFSPDWKFHKSGRSRKVGSRELAPPTAIAAELNWSFDLIQDLIEMGFTGTADSARRFANLVLIEFDLNRPMKDLVKYAKYVLARAVRNYHHELKERGIKPLKSRRRFQDYDIHLKVWDLSQENKSASEIAALVFPQENKTSAAQKVYDHLKAAEKLILDGYTEIR